MKNKKENIYTNIEHSSQLPPGVVIGIVETVRQAFGKAPADTAEHIKGDRVVTIEIDDKIVGFRSAVFGSPRAIFAEPNMPSTQGVYLAAATVDQAYQGQGLYSQLNEPIFAEAIAGRARLIFTRTQNPVTELGLKHQLGKLRERGLIADFSLERHYRPGQYGSMLTKEKPHVQDAALQERYSQLQYEKGDAFILMFHLSYPEDER